MTILPGDLSLDLVVDATEEFYLKYYYGLGGNVTFGDGDLNGDGIIEYDDFVIFNLNLGIDLTNLSLLSDLNGDWAVDELAADILWNNRTLTKPTAAQGNLNGDNAITTDLDLLLAQYGLKNLVAS